MSSVRNLNPGDQAVKDAQDALQQQLQKQHKAALDSGNDAEASRIKKHMEDLTKMQSSLMVCWG